jgi:ketosteroid isomerase-like protein
MSQPDLDALNALNTAYVASVQKGDVDWFRANLADDFMCTNPDASFFDKAGFLELIGKGARINGLIEDMVQVRLLGDFAIIHARITYKGASGAQHFGRFTDDWAKRDGVWRCVSAHTAGEEF